MCVVKHCLNRASKRERLKSRFISLETTVNSICKSRTNPITNCIDLLCQQMSEACYKETYTRMDKYYLYKYFDLSNK